MRMLRFMILDLLAKIPHESQVICHSEESYVKPYNIKPDMQDEIEQNYSFMYKLLNSGILLLSYMLFV